ncbi:MAG TPA: ATP-binding protein [Caldilineaceae bacterium]|nr:ATP-binding protein [Caldilineaceae bacterium]
MLNRQWRSLAWKLTLAFVMVALISALFMAFLIDWQVRRQFERFVSERYESHLMTELRNYYAATGSWRGVEVVFKRSQDPEVERHGGLRRFRPVLLNAEGQSVYVMPVESGPTSGPTAGDEQAPHIEAPILVGGQPVGWLRLRLPTPTLQADPAAMDFLRLISRTIGQGAFFAGIVALILGIVLARTLTRPIQALTAATRAMAQGALGMQVKVETQDELGELGSAFNQMSSDLARSMALRRQMTADIAHDLRTPLSVILGYTEALQDGKFQGSPTIYKILHEEAQQLGRLIEDLRILSLADAGELPLQRTPMAPGDLLARAAAVYQAQAAGQGVSLQVTTAPDLPFVDVDAERMGQVLGNLITNALRYTPAGGAIHLLAQVHPRDDATASRSTGSLSNGAGGQGDPPIRTQVLLRVEDTGSGIAPDDLPHIFERFYRADKARPSTGETGLGLAIAKSLVEMHDGSITAASTPNQGTTFTITLPAVGQVSHP